MVNFLPDISEMVYINNIHGMVFLQMLDYLDKEWIGKRLIEDKPAPLSVISFEANDGKSSMVSSYWNLIINRVCILNIKHVLEDRNKI